jgi:hypothetical protein
MIFEHKINRYIVLDVATINRIKRDLQDLVYIDIQVLPHKEHGCNQTNWRRLRIYGTFPNLPAQIRTSQRVNEILLNITPFGNN